MKELKDNFGRTHNYLRISLTDRCNLNCIYCNPSRSAVKGIPRNDILSYDEILRLINIFIDKFGINKLRFTDGEPFARKGTMDFFAQLAPVIREHAIYTGITTNGTLLKDKLPLLKEYDIQNLNISLDSLNPDTFKKKTGSSMFGDIITLRKAVNSFINSDTDILLTTGGVSVGKYDYLKDVFNESGVETIFWRVNIKPGKPIFFGKHVKGNKTKLIFGLPGNPVSSFVNFTVFLKSAIRKYYVKESGSGSSGNLVGLGISNCLIVIPEDIINPSAGEIVECINI